jgi:hypothetical protein
MVRVKTKFLSLIWAFTEYRRAITHRLFDKYRPEQHYMRGPGPRCRAKGDLPQT